MMKIVLPEEMRAQDERFVRELGLPGTLLMETAARAVADEAERMAEKGRIVVLCGPGNNGGDGLAAARMLHARGRDVLAVLLSSSLGFAGDAAVHYAACAALSVPLLALHDGSFPAEALAAPALVIDALFGTGLTRAPEGVFAEAISWTHTCGAPVLAVDIPSGVAGATGAVHGCAVRADVTVTFAAAKRGHFLYPGRRQTGALRVCDIGLPRSWLDEVRCEILTEKDLRRFFPPREKDTHKGTYGHVALLVGSVGYSGAARLAALGAAAVHSGAGLVSLGVPQSLLAAMQSVVLEVMTRGFPDDVQGRFSPDGLVDMAAFLEGKSVVAIGSGWGADETRCRLVRSIFKATCIPIVVDADALNAVSMEKDMLRLLASRAIMTPHPGEMARLLGCDIPDVTADPVSCARDFAAAHDVVVVLKGATTVIAAPDGRSTLNTTGTPGMASGGSGDVLSGMIASFVAQRLSLYDAARCACFVHGAAGEAAAGTMGEMGMASGDIAQAVPGVLVRALGY